MVGIEAAAFAEDVILPCASTMITGITEAPPYVPAETAVFSNTDGVILVVI